MLRFLNTIDSETKKQLLRFLLVGIFVVMVDFTVYTTLVNIFELSFTFSKAISFISGTVIAFLLNKFITFSQTTYIKNEFNKFLLLYTFTFFANVLTNDAVLNIGSQQVIVAYLIATSVSTVLNFIGQKWWVFRPHPTS